VEAVVSGGNFDFLMTHGSSGACWFDFIIGCSSALDLYRKHSLRYGGRGPVSTNLHQENHFWQTSLARAVEGDLFLANSV